PSAETEVPNPSSRPPNLLPSFSLGNTEAKFQDTKCDDRPKDTSAQQSQTLPGSQTFLLRFCVRDTGLVCFSIFFFWFIGLCICDFVVHPCTGIGIPSESRSRLFQAFTQVTPDTATKYGGTGLGLVISRTITEKFGGSIWLGEPETGQPGA